MFGDSLFPTGRITATDALTGGGSITLLSDLPLAAGARRVLIAEHNKALPVDRAYFNYNHFHNAFFSRASGTTALGVPLGPFLVQRDDSLDRYMLGIEKTFNSGLWSVELRMPLAGQFEFAHDTGALFFPERASIGGGEVGNLAVIQKTLLYQDDGTAISAGFGVDIPTGDAVQAQTATSLYTIENDAVNLMPFVAVLRNPNDRFFWHTFAQLDLPLEGNTVRFRSLPPEPSAAGISGKLTDQTLLRVDIGGGYWLIRQPQAPVLTGLALISETHFTTTLQGSDVVAAARPTLFPGGAMLDLRNPAGSMNVVNTTFGVHIELIDDSTIRIAASLPTTTGDDRFFDSELLFQLGRRF